MLQYKSKFTAKIIEVNEIDAHWYNGHEEYEKLNAQATETVEAKPSQETTIEVKKRGRPRKVH